MTQFVYSAQSNAFYPTQLKDRYEQSGSWPSDGVPVTDDTFREFTGQKEGYKRVAGEDGYPVWEEVQGPTEEEILAAKRASMKVSSLQAKIILSRQGHLAQVEQFIENGTEEMKLAWSDAQEFRRTSPLVNAIGDDLGLSEEQKDDLFEQAKQVEV